MFSIHVFFLSSGLLLFYVVVVLSSFSVFSCVVALCFIFICVLDYCFLHRFSSLMFNVHVLYVCVSPFFSHMFLSSSLSRSLCVCSCFLFLCSFRCFFVTLLSHSLFYLFRFFACRYFFLIHLVCPYTVFSPLKSFLFIFMFS